MPTKRNPHSTQLFPCTHAVPPAVVLHAQATVLPPAKCEVMQAFRGPQRILSLICVRNWSNFELNPLSGV